MYKFLILSLAVTFVSANFGHDLPIVDDIGVLNTNVKNNNILNNILTSLPLLSNPPSNPDHFDHEKTHHENPHHGKSDNQDTDINILPINIKDNNIANNILSLIPLRRTLNGYVPNYNNYGYSAGSYRGIIPDINGVKDTVGSLIPMKRSFKYRNLPSEYNNYPGPYKRDLVPQLLTTLLFKRSMTKSRTFSKNNYNSYGY